MVMFLAIEYIFRCLDVIHIVELVTFAIGYLELSQSRPPRKSGRVFPPPVPKIHPPLLTTLLFRNSL
jgi:hypothetical protein